MLLKGAHTKVAVRNSLPHGVRVRDSWRLRQSFISFNEKFSTASTPSLRPVLATSEVSSYVSPSHEPHSHHVPPIPRSSARSSNSRSHDSKSSPRPRRALVQETLAKIEATRGVVSPYLRDTFAREHDYLRISLTEKCNLRCTYCMPEEGAPLSPKEHLLTTDEVVKLASIFVNNGVRKIRLTGGEPTVRQDLPEIVERLSALGLTSLGMTSNGIALPRKLSKLVAAGLTHLNVSLDTLDPFKFELMTRRRGHATVLKVLEQASALLDTQATGAGHLRSLKLNVVIMNKVNDEEVTNFVELTKDLPISIRFIEYMPFDGNKWSTSKMVASADLLARIRAISPPDSLHAITPEPSDTARIYRREGYKGSFGFISSMTDHFCSGCSRLRLGADGSIKVCLFGEPKLSLRDLLRAGASDLEISQHIGKAVKGKHFAHDGKSVELDSWSQAVAPVKRAHLQTKTHPKSRYPSHYRGGAMKAAPLYLLGSLPLSAGIRAFSTSFRRAQDDEDQPRLTHISAKTGKPTMVSISDKSSSKRSATAVGTVAIPKLAYELLTDSSGGKNKATRKGDVLTVAQLAGIMGAKKTPDLIPLCHPISLTNVQVELALKDMSANGKDRYAIGVEATAECVGATGVEMEALTAVNVACLTVWDMLKAVAGKDMIIENVKVVRKSGGKSGDWERPS